MVLELLLNAVFSCTTALLDFFQLDAIAWTLDLGVLTPFLNIVRSVLYFLPVHTIGAIIGLTVAFGVFRIAIRLVLTIWDLIPLL